MKIFKDMRRRVVETTLQTVGKSERTVDENLEAAIAHFHRTVDELNKTGSVNSNMLLAQKSALAEAAELAGLLFRLAAKSAAVSDNAKDVANRMHEAWAIINEVYRPSIEVECLDKALKPITAHIAAASPHIDEKVKERAATVVDYDSYRRRLKEKEAARDAAEAERANLEAQGKAAKSTDNIKMEVSKFEAKVVNTENQLYDETAALKSKLKEADATAATLLSDLMIVNLVAQEELFSRAAEQLRAVIDHLPLEYAGRVQELRMELGAKVTKASAEKSLIDKVVPVQRGSREYVPPPPAVIATTPKVLSVVNEPKVSSVYEQPKVSIAVVQPEVPSVVAQSFADAAVTFETFPLASSTDSHSADLPHASSSRDKRQSSVGVVGLSTPTVTALYDNQADTDDELSFQAGDVIEVLDMGADGSGWGRGRLGFKEGLFPLNFVKINT